MRGWVTTVAGNALANASLTKPITRSTAERLLRGVIDRAASYNADPDRILAVTRLDVFGSYLDPEKDRLGDLDLGIEIVRRFDSDSWTEMSLAYTAKSGRTFNRYTDRLFWPLHELLRYLKNRSSAIGFTDEDLALLTTCHERIYDIRKDPTTIQPPPEATVQRL